MQDVCDHVLPARVDDLLTEGLEVVMTALVIAVVTPIFVAVLPFLAAIFYATLVRLRSSRVPVDSAGEARSL